jgi:hypothetical protein
MRKQLVVPEEALPAELAQRVHAALDLVFALPFTLVFRGGFVALVGEHGGQVQREDVGRVERVLVREDLFVPDAEVAVRCVDEYE